MSGGAIRSAVVVARLLGSVGYDGPAHQAIESYWKSVVMDKRRAKGVERTEKKFHNLVASLDLTEKERKVLGAFISLRSQMSFDAGLRIGMTAFAHVTDKTVQHWMPKQHRSDRTVRRK